MSHLILKEDGALTVLFNEELVHLIDAREATGVSDLREIE